MPTARISLSDLDYGPEEEAAVLRVLRSRWLSMGPEVQAFESEMAAFLGVEHAVAVSSGTAALHLSMLALDLGDGAEVIQPAINFVAAANTTVMAGATPVFADVVSVDEPTIDPLSVERLITPRTRAVVVMHYGGYVARMTELSALCARHGLVLIEDACHAIGARHISSEISSELPSQPDRLHGRRAGAIGDVGCFSFFSNKNLATGEGGLVVTRRADVAARLRQLRSHGMTTLTWDRHRGHASSYDVVAHGFNYRLDELHAALGRCQLAKLERNNSRRRDLVARYRQQLHDRDGWRMPFHDYAGDSSYHLATVLAPDREARRRAVERLTAAGIQHSLHYPCIADFTAFEAYRSSAVAVSRDFAARVITLPLHPALGTGEVDAVCAQLTASAAQPAEVARHGA